VDSLEISAPGVSPFFIKGIRKVSF
jgi:hypothetical protein